MPFQTALEAALADLKKRGVIKRDTDILEPLGYKSKGTVSSYATGAMKMSKDFRTKFENLYQIKLADYEKYVGKDIPAQEQDQPEGSADPDIRIMYQQQMEVQKRILEDLGVIKVSLDKLTKGKTPASLEEIRGLFSEFAKQENVSQFPFQHAFDMKKKEDNSQNVGNPGK